MEIDEKTLSKIKSPIQNKKGQNKSNQCKFHVSAINLGTEKEVFFVISY